MRHRSLKNGLMGRIFMFSRMIFAAILVVTWANPAFAKMGEEPRSFSLEDKSLDKIDRKVLPAIDIARLKAEDKKRAKDKSIPGPLRFAEPARVAYTLKNSGTWQNLPDGRLWRLRLRTPNAKSINLGFSQFDMPENAKLWIYSPSRENVEGPYTAKDRSRRGRLWTPPIEGEEIVVEVFVPSGVREPVIQIGSVNQGYLDFTKDSPDKSGSCNNDVICPLGDDWRDQIRSVARYSINGTGLCSGQLLNNTAVDRKPYFLSANHCGVNSSNDDTLVFFWNFQSPSCGAHGGGDLTQNQTGAIFRASNAASDFVLVELDDSPLPFNVYFSGWDATGGIPASTVGIHHPSGDEKAISFNTNAVTSTAYGSDTSNAAANHWRVDDWEDGTTEPGSSGSCIWDAATKRCVGQLHGGYAACPDENDRDWYGKLSASWTGGGTDSTRLSNWLDPVGGGTIMAMDGDPHITTANGTRYDFQGAGEFVSLRDGSGLEIQTRMTGIGTDFTPGADPYHGLATCVSINTAVAARVGRDRVTIQPNINGRPDLSGLQVRVNGDLVTVGSAGIDLGQGARIDKYGDSFQLMFPNGTVLMVTPLFWNSQGKWFLNVEVVRHGTDGMGGLDSGGPTLSGGLMASIAPGSWLPNMPDGSALGPMPASLGQRYTDLYQKFGESWRVTAATSLFDYAPGTSTATFTDTTWPRQNSSCRIPNSPTVTPIRVEVARRLCRDVADKNMNEHCVFDVVNTGEPAFAKIYLTKQQVNAGLTSTRITLSADPVPVRQQAGVSVTVSRRGGGKGVPSGSVQFLLDGRNVGEPVKLNARGSARWATYDLRPGKHTLTANYIPARGSAFIASRHERVFTVAEK